ncbi:TIGR02680 family protein [Streptomyces chartreusis]|uniref:TIGR02680 family protein n=1 Tax=Streptomyces chartreusis TaxID=1969 RepID=UPI00364F34D6
MTIITVPPSRLRPSDSSGAHRWRLRRAGIVNVWYYYDQEFDLSGGRLVLRGTNGSGKSRALEMLLPFLLDADRRRMDATGSGKVRLEDLMRAGGDEQPNRLGYLWLEVERTRPADETGTAQSQEHLTIGALVRFARSTAEAKVWYFTTPKRVGDDLALMDESRTPLSRDALIAVIGANRITDRPEAHREQVRTQVFGLTGEAGRQRYAGLLQLLHTLRSPDVGNRIDEGRLPQILSDALPPLSEQALLAAGEELDGLEETRAALARLEHAYEHVANFLKVYTRYATGVLADSAHDAHAAARRALEAESAEREQTGACEQLARQHSEAVASQEEADSYARELAATAAGIKDSRAYREARELAERLARLDALAIATDLALDGAAATRREESASVTACSLAAREARTAALAANPLLTRVHEALGRARLSTRLPDLIDLDVREDPLLSEPVRTQRIADPVTVTRPAPALLYPAPAALERQLDDWLTSAGETAEAAGLRRNQALARGRDAAQLDKELHTVRRAEERAEETAQDALLLEEAAADSAIRRDDCAIALAVDWRAWITSSSSRSLLPDVDWSQTCAAFLLLDAQALAGEYAQPGADDSGLAALDLLPHQAAAGMRAELARRLAELETADRQDAALRAQLQAEAAELRQARDVPPPSALWADNPPDNGVPLWQLLEFRPGLSEQHQAGLEAALMASGLLTAHVTSDGVVSESGQLLLSADAPPAVPSARTALTVVADGPVAASRVTAVLDRIALDVPGHTTWVHRDGSFGIGVLRGRHSLPAARYIGAAARAAARAERLEQISQELAGLEAAAEGREQQRAAVHAQQAELEAHLAAAPRSHELSALRAQAVASRQTAAAKHRQATELTRAAEQARRQWSAAERSHQERCAAFSLPTAAADLAAVSEAADQAVAACQELITASKAVPPRLAAMARAGVAVEEARGRRQAAEDKAATQWAVWSAQAAELAALQESVGASAEEIHAKLAEVEAAAVQAEEERTRHSRTVTDLAGRVGTAEANLETARRTSHEALAQLRHSAGLLAARASHPALAPAATGQRAQPMQPAASPAELAAAAQSVLEELPHSASRADATALLRALSVLEREMTGSYDVIITVDEGLHIVELADSDGRRYVTDAALDLKERRDRGQEALTSRERTAFQHFVLGGVAEELRTRIGQAHRLLTDMNASLRSITTSHGIGVRLRWNLAEDAGHPIARIKELIARDARVLRTQEQEELIELLKARVDERFRADPQAGYTAHLRDALDYRSWHTLEVFITGPEPGRDRRLSRRARLSQGETRFVSYVTLFAAADAYLSGLPDPARALRLILLDDAFAKVDNRTIAELMSLLVRMDLDFVMTGHALWGFFPEVPAVDAYEVRRAEGTAAITTHVHWDGHTRHLRLANHDHTA